MDKPEKKHERVEHTEQQRISEQRRRQEADEGVNRLWKQVHEQGLLTEAKPDKNAHQQSKISELATRKGQFTDTQKQEFHKVVDKEMYGGDKTKRTADETPQQKADQLDKKKIGQIVHEASRENRRAKEYSKGRAEGVDFQTEAALKHPDGGRPRPDYVDHQKDMIVDDKPIDAHGKGVKKLLSKYENQRERHNQAYENQTGRKIKEYRYDLYSRNSEHPVPKDVTIKYDKNSKEREATAGYNEKDIPAIFRKHTEDKKEA